jgi:hypothetical protein
MLTDTRAIAMRKTVQSEIEERVNTVAVAIKSGSRTLAGEWLRKGDYPSLIAFALLNTTRKEGRREKLFISLAEILIQHRLGNLGKRETDDAILAAFEQMK